MELSQIIALSIFVGVFILFSTRVIHRALATLLGALLLALWAGPKAVISAVIPEVLLVTAGVMILAGFVRRSGVAAWLALKTAKVGRGRPTRILVLSALLTFVLAALFGPAVAVVLVVPVALLLASELDVPALPFVVTLSWTSLLGGVTVLTATPGNLWLGMGLGIDGAAWLGRMAPYSLAGFVVTLVTSLVVFRTKLRVTNERRARVLEFDESRSLENRALLAKTLIVLALVMSGLVASHWTGWTPSLIIVGGAVVLMLWDDPRSIDRSVAEIDGGTLLFFGGLFAVVVALAVSGASLALAQRLPADPLLLLGGSALLGAFVDQGAVMGSLVPTLQHWSAQGATGAWTWVALGSTLGAGATLWGAASNATALSLSGQGSYKPTWREFTLYGLLFSTINLICLGSLALLLS